MTQHNGLDWARDGSQWPLRHLSRFVQTPRLRWHVQHAAHRDPRAPTVLLLHGTGASTHSWRALIPLLSTQYSVLALDFPGHAFTAMPERQAVPTLLSLPGMAAGVLAVRRRWAVTLSASASNQLGPIAPPAYGAAWHSPSKVTMTPTWPAVAEFGGAPVSVCTTVRPSRATRTLLSSL
jgi:magnesium chelatase accessory protein